MEYMTAELANGLKIIHKHDPSLIAYCGVFINTGTRDETPNEHGLAHFIEHVIFKGTKKRKAFHINSRLENVGGELNAYTTKEYTCLHATFLRDSYNRTLELMADIIFNSIFPPKELEREKEVIIDEINSYKDSPSELIYDDFEEYAYPDNPIGRNTLGNKKMINRFTRDDILRYLDNNYCTGEMVLCSIGNISFNRLKNLAEQYFNINNKKYKKNKREKAVYKPFEKTMHKKTHQLHCIMGTEAYNIMDNRRTALQLLNNILCGIGSNSRLNIALREKLGISYNIESLYTAYSDTGLLNIYFGTDKNNIDKSLDVIYKEIKKLQTKKLGTLQLSKAKRQMIGQLAIAAEHKEGYMISMGKHYMLFNKCFSVEKIKENITNVTATQLMDIANEILQKDRFSTLIYR